MSIYQKAVSVFCLKKIPSIVDNLSVRKVCVDDFAIRKRFSYGTVMVDLETHRIIDLIPTRKTEEVRAWLATYPNIEVISRDGAQIYANASEKSHPGVVQVSDRFHMIKGLTEAMTKYIIREFPTRLEIPAVTISDFCCKLYLNILHFDARNRRTGGSPAVGKEKRPRVGRSS